MDDQESPDNSPVYDRRYRIAHLSDLHFGRKFDVELWRYIVGLLMNEHHPDVVVVTGDIVDTPTLFGLGVAYQQLVELQKRVGCQVLLVPGNHDVGVFGNVALWPWSGKMRIVFAERYQALFAQLPTFLQHRQKPWWHRCGDRGIWTCRFAWRRLFAWTRFFRRDIDFALGDPGAEAFPLLEPDVSPRVVFSGFDSNDRLRLATGSVKHDRILSLQIALHGIQTGAVDRSLCPRIALVHHHPLPIPYTRESLTSFEPFLVFRNAGTLLNELARLDFDLVLHGHKHYWHFARLSFDAPGRTASELVIIGAGSGTIRLNEPGRNSFNLIDVMRNGGIVHRPIFYGQGMTAVGSASLDTRAQPRGLFSIDTIKSRAHRKAVARQGSDCDLIERCFFIEESGAASMEHGDRGLQVLGERRLRHVKVPIRVFRGRVVPASVELNDRSRQQGHALKIDRRAPPVKELIIQIDLGSEISSGHTGVSYGVKIRTINTFAIARWEAEQLFGIDKDFAGVVVRRPAKCLRLVVTLPEGFTDPSPEVVCERPRAYPLLLFDDEGMVIPPKDLAEWVRDQEMTHHERGNLKATGKNKWELEITEPMVGFHYAIHWWVKTPGTEASVIKRGEADQLRCSLLRLFSETSLPDKLTEVKAKGQDMLDRIFCTFYGTLGSQYALDEKMVAAVFIYDPRREGLDKPPLLRLLYESGPGRDQPGRCEAIPLNEGVTGAAFKKRSPSIYVLPELVGRGYDGAYVYYPDSIPSSARDRYAALVALPLFLRPYQLGEEVPPPEEVLGVFTLGTNARDSQLLQWLPQSDNGQTSLSDEPFVELWTVALGFIRGLAQALQEATGSVEDPGKNPDNADAVQAG